ncbi:MAG: aspartate--tRNA(Asn) ligase [Chloroflexi bacterium]|nr:aspartate--tRNA(Asn) ligase [Chloroflexota bacterium]MBU1751729.1 aspartate--tRNA(Asn) ligase [Chloroflexota bacterium]
MERVLGSELEHHAGQRVKLAGWVHNLRLLGKVNFLRLRDASGISQVVLTKSDLEQLDGALPESVVEVEGMVVAEPQAPGGFEVHEPRITVLSKVSEGLPFPINKPVLNVHLDTFLNHAPVGLRNLEKRALFRLAAGVMAGFRRTLDEQGFVEIASPKIVESATESGTNVFKLDYFGRPAYLAQSPQFYKEVMVGVFERVYEVGPVFRAEPHNTARHVNEYVSLDAEMGFICDHLDVMRVLTRVIKDILAHLQDQYAGDLALLDVQMSLAPETIPHIYFPDAQQFIYERHGEDCRGEPDLAPQHERWLGKWARAEHQSDFLFVTGYPMAKRPFYTHPNPADPRYSNSFDLLFRGTELVTGGQRLHRYEDHVAALAAQGISDLTPFEGYLQAFRYGMPPHGGFAIGLERFVMQLTGAQNLRETTLFPRDLDRLSP